VGFCGNEESGVRIPEPGVRSQNEEHLLPAFCFLPSALWLLPSRGFELAGLLAGAAVYDKMSPPTGKEEGWNFKK
jgi:hypothetical protein